MDLSAFIVDRGGSTQRILHYSLPVPSVFYHRGTPERDPAPGAVPKACPAGAADRGAEKQERQGCTDRTVFPPVPDGADGSHVREKTAVCRTEKIEVKEIK